MCLIPAVWKEKRVIESFDVDILGRLHPQTLFSFLLNAAWNHACKGTYGFTELTAHDLYWVLVKAQILIKRLPNWREQITIETWGKRKVRLYALRDFIITSEEGEKLISATSSWMILDRKNGKPQRFDEKSESLPWNPQKNEIETNLEKVPQLNYGKELRKFRIHFSDIDVNRHVNSAKYVEWIINSHSQKHLETNNIGSIEISFLSEASSDDVVAVYSEVSNGFRLYSVKNYVDEKELCRARIKWQPCEA